MQQEKQHTCHKVGDSKDSKVVSQETHNLIRKT